MLFSSYFFLYFFLPAFFILYFSFREIKYKNFFIMLFSSAFFIWGDPLFYLIALCSMVFEYFVLHQYNKGKIIKKKYVIFLLIAINILLLSYFKYGTFLISLINDIFNYQFLYASSYLPLGISFVIFQKISFGINMNPL